MRQKKLEKKEREGEQAFKVMKEIENLETLRRGYLFKISENLFLINGFS